MVHPKKAVRYINSLQSISYENTHTKNVNLEQNMTKLPNHLLEGFGVGISISAQVGGDI